MKKPIAAAAFYLGLICASCIISCAQAPTVEEGKKMSMKDTPDSTLQKANKLFRTALKLSAEGQLEKAIEAYEKVIALGRKDRVYYMSMYNIACACSLLGRKNEAFEWLEKSINGMRWDPYMLLFDPDLKPLHEEEEWRRFVNLAARPGTGPRFSEEQLFISLKSDYPGLREVRAALNEGDKIKAKAALAAHFRGRKKPRWKFTWPRLPRPGTKKAREIITRADDVLRHHFSFYKDIPYQFGDEIDWKFNPTTQPGSPYARDYEWGWVLNRHPMWRHLAQAYLITRNEKYAAEFVKQMTGWVKRNPVPIEAAWNDPFSCWRTIETGIRMAMWGWPNVFFAFLHSPSFSDDALLTMVRSMVDHARYLRKFHRSGNWLTMEMNGLFHVAVLLPELKQSDDWREFAITTLHKEMKDVQVYPDGFQFELTQGYHNVALQNFAGPVPLTELNDVALPKGYKALLEKMYDVNLYSMMPDRHLPSFNDSGIYKAANMLKQGLEIFPQRDDWRWVVTGGKKGKEPQKLSHAFPYAGYLTMRSGWDCDARYLAFDVGPFGAGHQHEDKLNFIMSAYGARMVVEAGIYFYDNSKWRSYILSARGHNVIHVDGRKQHRGGVRETYTVEEPMPHVWKTTKDYDYAEGYYGGEFEGFGPGHKHIVSYTRRILFVKGAAWGGGDYWIVVDTLRPTDKKVHRYESTFHIDMEKVEADSKTGIVTARNEDGPGLVIWPVAGSKLETEIITAQEKPEVQGWMPNYPKVGCRPLPTVCYRQKTKGPAHFAYVFCPLKKGAMSPIEDFHSSSMETAGAGSGRAFHVGFGEGRRHVVVVSDSGGMWRVEGKLASGKEGKVILTLVDKQGVSRLIEVVSGKE